MFKILIAALFAAAVSAGAASYVVARAGPSTAELDADIAAIDESIAETAADAARYSGGVILTQINLRLVVLKNTREMLDQKRKSYLRGIVLSYQDSTPRLCQPTSDPQSAEELERALAEAHDAQQEAARYSGGLIQAMVLVREATAMATAAAIEQRRAFAKLGISLPRLVPGDAAPPERPGAAASDRDALK